MTTTATTLPDTAMFALLQEHLGLRQRRDDTVIDPHTGRYHDAQRYRDLLRAAIASAAAVPAPIWEDAMRQALLEAQAGLEFAAARLPAQVGDFVPAHLAALKIVNDALASAAQLEPHPPHRQCGCADCAPSFEPDGAGTQAAAPAAWPKLERDAALNVDGTARFGKGVSAQLLVEAAYRNAEMTAERQSMTPEQRADEERKRRALWDMVHGAPATAAQGDALDAERLDWLLGPGRRMAIDGFGGQYRVVDATCNLVITDWHPTQRAAIDAARAANEGAGNAT